MRRFIATACAFTILGFTIALANADTNDTTSSTGSTTTATGQTDSARDTTFQDPYNTGGNMGGAAGTAADQSTGSMADERTTTTRSETQWKDSKTCTDAEGVTYYRGKKGYEHCVTAAAAKKNAKKDQMSGTAGNDSTKDNSVKSDSSSMGGSSNPGSGTDGTSPSSDYNYGPSSQ